MSSLSHGLEGVVRKEQRDFLIPGWSRGCPHLDNVASEHDVKTLLASLRHSERCGRGSLVFPNGFRTPCPPQAVSVSAWSVTHMFG